MIAAAHSRFRVGTDVAPDELDRRLAEGLTDFAETVNQLSWTVIEAEAGQFVTSDRCRAVAGRSP